MEMTVLQQTPSRLQ